MASRRRYLCSRCRTETKWLDGDAPDAVRTGCQTCGKIQRFVAYHTDAFVALPRGGRA